MLQLVLLLDQRVKLDEAVVEVFHREQLLQLPLFEVHLVLIMTAPTELFALWHRLFASLLNYKIGRE